MIPVTKTGIRYDRSHGEYWWYLAFLPAASGVYLTVFTGVLDPCDTELEEEVCSVYHDAECFVCTSCTGCHCQNVRDGKKCFAYTEQKTDRCEICIRFGIGRGASGYAYDIGAAGGAGSSPPPAPASSPSPSPLFMKIFIRTVSNLHIPKHVHQVSSISLILLFPHLLNSLFKLISTFLRTIWESCIIYHCRCWCHT